MGSLNVVFVKPCFRCFASFSNRLEEPAIQAAISEDAVESFVVSGLSPTSWTPRWPTIELSQEAPWAVIVFPESKELAVQQAIGRGHVVTKVAV